MSNGTPLPCVQYGDPPPSHSITFPGGIVLQSPPIFRPHDRLVELEGLFAALSPAMAGMGPVFTIIEVVGAIVDMVKAIATLNPVEIANAAVAFAQAVDKLLGIIPQVSLPLFIFGLLNLVVDLLATLIDFLQGIQQQQAQIDAMKEYAQEHGIERMYQDALCLEENIQVQLEYFNNGMGALAAFIVIIEALGSIAGLDISIDADTGGGDTSDTLDRLASIVDTITLILEAIPIS